jgi:integrase
MIKAGDCGGCGRRDGGRMCPICHRCRCRTARSAGCSSLRIAVERAGLDSFTFHGLRHSFVAILVAAGCNVREVSEWAGHNSVAFTLTRYGGLFEDGSEAAVDRLDALFRQDDESSGVAQLRRR